jgi:hypothetical protein
MMRHYDELAVYERDGFEVIVDKTWEDIHPDQLFEREDAPEICDKIDRGVYDWFMLRVRVMLDGHELGSHYLGGCCYEDAREVLTDGCAEDCIYAAMEEARREARRLVGSLQRVIDKETA